MNMAILVCLVGAVLCFGLLALVPAVERSGRLLPFGLFFLSLASLLGFSLR